MLLFYLIKNLSIFAWPHYWGLISMYYCLTSLLGDSFPYALVWPYCWELFSVCSSFTSLGTLYAPVWPYYGKLFSMYSFLTSLLGTLLHVFLFNLIIKNSSPYSPVWPHYRELPSMCSCLTSLLGNSSLVCSYLTSLGTPLHVPVWPHDWTSHTPLHMFLFDLMIGDSSPYGNSGDF